MQDPKNPTALAMLGMVSAQRRDWTEASRAIGSAVRVAPGDPAAQNALALAELPRDRATSVKLLENVVSAHPGYAPAAYNLGAIHEWVLHDADAALGWYRQYLQKAGASGSHVETAKQAVARLSGTGQPEAATTDLAAAKRFTAEGIKQLTAGKYNSAITHFEQAIAADPAQKETHYNMGYAYFQLEKYDRAATAFRSALGIDPRYADAHYNLTFAYCQQRDWRAAERQARELAKLDPVRGGQMLKFIAENRKR
jgi:tetratricopeptide (TPR) repeat protein